MLKMINDRNLTPKKWQIYEIIREGLLTHRWKHGEKLSSYELSNTMGVSRTPIKEALKQLENEGFLKVIPQVGCIVNTFTHEDVVEIFMLRKSLEGLATYLAATRAQARDIETFHNLILGMEQFDISENLVNYSQSNREFHQAIVNAAYSPRLSLQAQFLWGQADFFNVHIGMLQGRSGSVADSLSQHKRILEYVQNGKPDQAKKAMEDHMQDCLDRIIATYLKNNEHV